MIKKYIGTNSVEDSNIFLGKLWCELEKISPNGWLFQPTKQGNKINIGKCNFGSVEFDYKVKGCIQNIYIDNEDIDNKIENAIEVAKANYKLTNKYIAIISFKRIVTCLTP